MKEIIKEAKTVEGSILLILEELGCKRDELDIEVIQEPVKGIFGIVKMAKVAARFKNDKNKLNDDLQDTNEKIKDVLSTILKFMGMKPYEIHIKQEGNYPIFEISCEYEGLLIGHHGKTIESIQYLLNKIINPKEKDKTKFFIDIGGYLNKHKENLKKTTDIAVKKVKEKNEDISLPPMNAYDRRIIHLYLKDSLDVSTCSQGEGNLRHVVISVKHNDQ